ncbi:MAG TPA: tRNA (adenosine(37)-N6)-threonylcarbamoyltransferase complex dimerization subunit type 1 TsaB [Sphingobacterium sp.]|mgnify:CR=1 FL=1|nr:tRNA (adenosine(37)-N6)-threonylcarbamoyltransferase complex dimerization subunit type 1 TsaB [Sphingobacterium sp.]
MNDPYILHIDTATEVCSVSLSKGADHLDSIETPEPNQHAAKLTSFVEEILERHCLSSRDLAAVSVSMGPGSYTGLRIGVSTAKGLCYGLDIPLIGINTLEIMYAGYKNTYGQTEDTLYCPMIDARRMEVYMSIWNEEGKIILPTTAKIIAEDSFIEYSEQSLLLFGSGAHKFEELFDANPDITIDTRYVHSSRHMCHLSWQRFLAQNFKDLIYFEPFYLKEFVATTPKK